MTTSFTEKRRCIDGSFNSYLMTETDQWDGQVLGAELTPEHRLQVVECDHYKSEDAEGIELSRGRWVKKSLVKRLFWQTDAAGCRVLARVVHARPL